MNLKEEAMPSSAYILARDIEFTVDKDGNVKVVDKDVEKITMVDEYAEHSFKIRKTDNHQETSWYRWQSQEW